VLKLKIKEGEVTSYLSHIIFMSKFFHESNKDKFHMKEAISDKFHPDNSPSNEFHVNDFLSDKLYMHELFRKCNLCPRSCHVDRANGKTGFCHMSHELVVSRAALHMWEEPCISGNSGSGAIFFSGCSLGCCFCQNRDISGGAAGKTISTDRLCEIFFELKEQGANNINLVTPDHYVPQIICAIDKAKTEGFDLPFVYNCSGYENANLIKMLEGYVDIYLPDFKFMSSAISSRYSNTPDYSEKAKESIAEMVRQCGGEKTDFTEEGIMTKGVIVRHLLLPGHIQDSKEIIDYLYSTYGNDIYISIMSQYTPMKDIGIKYPELSNKVSQEEYDELVDYAIDIGVENGFIQEGDTADESFIPPFDNEGV
jgi:putative pyruvate formate lyase activating enzyme